MNLANTSCVLSQLTCLLFHMTQTPLTAAVAKVIDLERERRDWSLRDLADKTGISLSTIARRRTGISSFTVLEVAAVADAFGVTVRDLVVEADRLIAEGSTPAPTVGAA